MFKSGTVKFRRQPLPSVIETRERVKLPPLVIYCGGMAISNTERAVSMFVTVAGFSPKI